MPHLCTKHKILPTVAQNLSASRALASIVPFSGRFSIACRKGRACTDSILTAVIRTHSIEQARARLGLELAQYHLHRRSSF